MAAVKTPPQPSKGELLTWELSLADFKTRLSLDLDLKTPGSSVYSDRFGPSKAPLSDLLAARTKTHRYKDTVIYRLPSWGQGEFVYEQQLSLFDYVWRAWYKYRPLETRGETPETNAADRLEWAGGYKMCASPVRVMLKETEDGKGFDSLGATEVGSKDDGEEGRLVDARVIFGEEHPLWPALACAHGVLAEMVAKNAIVEADKSRKKTLGSYVGPPGSGFVNCFVAVVSTAFNAPDGCVFAVKREACERLVDFDLDVWKELEAQSPSQASTKANWRLYRCPLDEAIKQAAALADDGEKRVSETAPLSVEYTRRYGKGDDILCSCIDVSGSTAG